MRNVLACVLASLFVVLGKAHAQDSVAVIRERIAECAQKQGELDRLECYDQLAQDLALIP